MQDDLSIIMMGLSSIALDEEVVGSHRAGDFFCFSHLFCDVCVVKEGPTGSGSLSVSQTWQKQIHCYSKCQSQRKNAVLSLKGNIVHACSVVGRGCLNFILFILHSSCSAFLKV